MKKLIFTIILISVGGLSGTLLSKANQSAGFCNWSAIAWDDDDEPYCDFNPTHKCFVYSGWNISSRCTTE